MSIPTDASLTSPDPGDSVLVVVFDKESATSDTEVELAAHDDLLLRLAPFDVVERHREAYRRCRYLYR